MNDRSVRCNERIGEMKVAERHCRLAAVAVAHHTPHDCRSTELVSRSLSHRRDWRIPNRHMDRIKFRSKSCIFITQVPSNRHINAIEFLQALRLVRPANPLNHPLGIWDFNKMNQFERGLSHGVHCSVFCAAANRAPTLPKSE
jgi:hypothetical protein